VSGSAPSATPKRVISASARVITPARAFNPRSSASSAPTAMAITFLSAPPTSTPTGSTLV
jgi:hypothetical protein